MSTISSCQISIFLSLSMYKISLEHFYLLSIRTSSINSSRDCETHSKENEWGKYLWLALSIEASFCSIFSAWPICIMRVSQTSQGGDWLTPADTTIYPRDKCLGWKLAYGNEGVKVYSPLNRTWFIPDSPVSWGMSMARAMGELWLAVVNAISFAQWNVTKDKRGRKIMAIQWQTL